MKRRSFLISACVIALVAVLAGCSDAVVYPEFPTGGFITQKGDFLEGQALDSTKFEITATYTNGATKTLTGVSIQDDNGTAKNGEDIWATVGIDANGYDVVAEGQITAYPIDHIEATVTGSGYSVDGTVPETDVQVTAYYYGSDRTQLSSMPLSSAEFYVDPVTATDDPAQGEVVVGTTLVGNYVETTVPVTLEVVPAGDIAKIEVTWNGTLPKLDYAEMPEISADDVTILAYDKDNKLVQAPAASDVVLSFVDGKTHLDLNSYDLKSGSVSVAVKAEYGELAPAYDDVSAVTVLLTVQPIKGFALTIGDKLGTPAAEDFLVDLYDANDVSFIERLAGEDVVLTYVGTDNKEISKDYEIASGAQIAIKAEYLGAEGKSTSYLPVVTAPAVDELKINSITLNKDYEFPAKQYYNNIAALAVDPSAVESISYTYTPAEGEAKTATLEYADFANAVAVEYSTTDGKVTALADEDDLAGADAKLYLHVTYTYAEGLTAEGYSVVTLGMPEETAIELTAEYATKYGTTPLTGSAVKYTVTTSNNLGDVRRDVVLTNESHDGFGILVNNANSDSFPSVGKKSQTVRVYLTDNKKVESNIVTIDEGTAFVAESEVASLTVEFNDAGKEKKLFVGDVISQVYTTSDFVVKYTPAGASASVEVPAGLAKVVGIDIATSEIATTVSTSLTVDFEYLADDGTMVSTSDEVAIDPIEWVEVLPQGAGVSLNNQILIAEGTAKLTPATYNLSNAVVTGLEGHGTTWALSAKANNGSASVSGNTFTLNAYGSVTITLSYFDGTSLKTVDFTVEA